MRSVLRTPPPISSIAMGERLVRSNSSQQVCKSTYVNCSPLPLRTSSLWMPSTVQDLCNTFPRLLHVSMATNLSLTTCLAWRNTLKTRMVLPSTKNRWCSSLVRLLTLHVARAMPYVRPWVRSWLRSWTTCTPNLSMEEKPTATTPKYSKRFGTTGVLLHRMPSTKATPHATHGWLIRRPTSKQTTPRNTWRVWWAEA